MSNKERLYTIEEFKEGLEENKTYQHLITKKMFYDYNFNSNNSKDLSKNDKKVFKAILKNEFNQK